MQCHKVGVVYFQACPYLKDGDMTIQYDCDIE